MRSIFTACLVLVPAIALADASVTVAPSAGAGELELDGRGTASTHVVKIADVTLSTDGVNGLTVYIASGTLTKADGRTPVPFQVLLVNDGASAPAASAFTVPAGATYTWATMSPGLVDKDLYIKYTPAALQDPGPYTANVGLSVVDN